MAALSACRAVSPEPTTGTEPTAGPKASASPTPASALPGFPDQLQPVLDFIQTEYAITAEQVTLETFEPMEWPDSCLGAPQPGEACLQVITPGYLAILDTPQGQLAFHLDSSGDRYRLAAQGLFPGPDQALIVWERSGGIAGICQRLEIHLDFTYIVSDCFTEETTSSGSLPEDEAAYLSGLIDRFRTFRYTLEPPQGSADMFSDQYNFTGDGAITPSQMEQEQLNEYLAKLANRLANSGPTSASTVIEQALLSSPAWK